MRKKLLNRLKTLFSWIVPVIRQIVTKKTFLSFSATTLACENGIFVPVFPSFFLLLHFPYHACKDMMKMGNDVQKQTNYQTFLAFYWLAKNDLHAAPEATFLLADQTASY